MLTTDDIQAMIDDCLKRKDKLTDWERGFIDGLSEQIQEHPLSQRQVERLDNIWERIT